jgi:hypothetical protein
MENKKQTISERINARLKEPENAIFKDGKWRFWFPVVLVLSLVNSCLTALIFNGATAAPVNFIVVAMGTLLCWIGVGALHYSDSGDGRLSRGVSLLDSIALCFMIAHFCFLLWAYGHLITLRAAETEYKVGAEAYNARVADVSKDTVKATENIVKISDNTVKVARLNNDAAYQLRVATQNGARVKSVKSAPSDAPSLPSLTPIELEKPKAPEQSSAAFLIKWDGWIRAANFGELILAAITLIYIRNRSAKFNAQGISEPILSVATGREYQSAGAPALRVPDAKKATPVATDEDPRMPALKELREHLRQIAFYIPNRFFKADLIQGGVSIRLCCKLLGADVTVKTTRQSNKLLDAVDRPDFRARLVAELQHQGFLIEKGGER